MKLFDYLNFPFKVYKNHKVYNELIDKYGSNFITELDTHKELKNRYGDLEKKLKLSDKYPELKNDLNNLSKEIEDFKITRKEMIENSKRNYSANNALEEWKKGHLKIISDKFEAVRSAAFSIAIGALLDSNKKMQKIPFIYYDLHSQKVIATDSTYELLEIDEKPEKLSLRGMLRYINRNNWDGIINSLRHKEKLRNYNVITSNNSKNLKMAINFYDYDRKTFGAGVSMYQPGFAKSVIPRLNFARKFNKTLKAVESEFKEVYELMKRPKNEIELLVESNF
jgi:predicted DNA-binding protein